MEGESWEDLDTTDVAHGALSMACLGTRFVRGSGVPQEALLQYVLDDPIVKYIDPKTWAVSGIIPRTAVLPISSPDELPIAEKFRLAFLERDTRLAPKRAKNARQHQQRAEKEWVMINSRAKALALASQAKSSVHLKNL